MSSRTTIQGPNLKVNPPNTSATNTRPTAAAATTKHNLPPVLSSGLKVSILGNVDSGKSTLVGCLCTGQRDSGRGSLRALVASHPHEAATGRTTNGAHHLFGYDSNGQHVFYNPLAKQSSDTSVKTVTTEETQNLKMNKAKAWHHIVTNSQRIVTCLDLAGHQRYLRTSISHLVSNMADVAMVLVSPNTGLSKMTIEHFSLCVALRIRMIVVVTKIDKAPLDVLKTLRVDLNNFITYQTQRVPVTIKGYSEIEQVLGAGPSLVPQESMVPIFYLSSTTLQHFDLLHAYLARVQPVTWVNAANTEDQVVMTDSAQDVDLARRNQKTDAENVNDLNHHTHNHQHVTSNDKNIGKDSLADSFHAMSLQSKTSDDESATQAPSVQATMSSALLPSMTFNTTYSGTTSTGTLSVSGAGPNVANAVTTDLGSGLGSSTSTTTSTVCSLQRDVGIPTYLQPLISGELRVEDRFYKANAGLILSGTVTFGAFDVSKADQFVLLGPFCSKVDPKQSTNILPHAAEAIHHATKKSGKTTAAATATNKATAAVGSTDAQLDVEFLPVSIKSMQQYRTSITKAGIGEGIGICIKYDEKIHKAMQKQFKYRSKYNHLDGLGRDDILKGMVLIGLQTPQTLQTASFPTNKLASAHDLIVPPAKTAATAKQAAKANNSSANNKPLPPQFTIAKYQFPYQLFLASSIDIDIEVLNPASCFKQGYQIVLHCSALVLPIIVESVLCVMDKPKTALFHNKSTNNNIIEMSSCTTATASDNRENPTLTAAIQQVNKQQPGHQIPINNDILLRYGQRGILRCRFLHQAFVYIHEGEQILLRDGSTRAIGSVSAVFF